MCDELCEIRAKLQVIDAGMDAVLADMYSALSQGRDAKPLCSNLYPLLLVKTELMQRLSYLTQQILFLFNDPLHAQAPVAPYAWPTHSWKSEPWPCSNSDAPLCP